MTGKPIYKQHPLAVAVFTAFNFAPMAHAVSPDIVISQVYGGGGNAGASYQNDFIELFNRGSAPVSLNGMSVQYASSAGSTWTNKTNLPNIVVMPGQYYLIQQAGGAVGAVLPTADLTGTINMSGSAGKVALVNSTTALSGLCPTAGIVDFVGFGPATNCSETSPTTANLTSSTAASRASAGCIDTDNNAADFNNGSVSPRNSTTALNSCNGSATNPILSLSVSSNAGSEAGTTAITVTANASSPVTGDQTVNLLVSGTGINAGDYSLSNAIISIPNGSSSGSVTFTVSDDALVEASETAILTLSTPSTGVSLGASIAQSIVITDNDIAAGNACGDAASKISAVQGSGATSPLIGSTGISIEGIVIGDYQGDATNSLRGFFVQEEDIDGDGNPLTSEGIFVYDGINGAPNVSVGDKVRVTGTAEESFNMTQLGSITNVQVCASNQAIPSAASLTLPVPNVPTGNLANANSAINAYYETFEGMMVRFPTTLKVSEYFELERYGQLALSQGGRIPTFTGTNNPSATGLINHNILLAKRQIILDDGNNTQNFALSSGQPLPYPSGGLSTTNTFRGGDSISNLTGILHWSFAGLAGTDAWRIRPVKELFNYSFTAANPRKPVAPVVDGSLKVASFNVLNYFTSIDSTASTATGPCGPGGNQDCRGADSASELARQSEKAAQALCGFNADIIGLMEIENNAITSLSTLTNAANAVAGCGPYAYINTGTIGGDAIKVGLLYKASSVTPTGSFELLTTTVDPRFLDNKNRPTLAQTFSQNSNGEKLTVAVNHLKSKGSACADVGDVDALDGQGNCNLTRKNAALAMVDWLNTDPTNSADPDFLIIGDLNSYAKEDPIKAIENGPDHTAKTADDYTNLVKHFGGDAAYSYVFDGQTGYLDHALASKSLLPQVTRTADWHINADEPVSFDYNDTIKDVGEASFEAKPAALPLYAADQYRTSDHDPVLIGLQLGETIKLIEGTAAKNTLSGTTGKDRIIGLAAADTLTGGLSADAFVYRATTEGIDTINDFTPGEDKIDLAALLQSIGYEGNDPLAAGIVKFAASGTNTVVYIDTDGAGPELQRSMIVVKNIGVASLNNPANFIF